nr:SapC family protein [uncultured Desulfuromonas sp.]
MPNIQPVTLQKHGQKHLLPLSSWEFAANQHLAGLLVSEFVPAAQFFPIVFAKQAEGEITVCALLGFEPQKNVFVDANKGWRTGYIPAMFRRYPFMLAQEKEQDSKEAIRFVLCIDEESGLVGDSGGTPFFDDNDKLSKPLQNMLTFCGECQKQAVFSKKFCALIEELDLLQPLKIEVKKNNRVINVEGLFHVDEKKLEALDDESFLKVRHSRFLPLIYAHLLSLQNLGTIKQRYRVINTTEANSALPQHFNF